MNLALASLIASTTLGLAISLPNFQADLGYIENVNNL